MLDAVETRSSTSAALRASLHQLILLPTRCSLIRACLIGTRFSVHRTKRLALNYDARYIYSDTCSSSAHWAGRRK